MHLGVLVPEFPTQTHIFFWREARALRQLGVKVTFISTRAPRDSCPHEFAVCAAAETHYVFPPSVRSILQSLPNDGWRSAFRYLLSLKHRGKRLAADAVMALCAADLAVFARREGIDHIHVHSCGDAAHLVAMARQLGGPTYSLHLHGDLPVYGTDHDKKMARALFVAAAARPMQRQVVEQVGVPESRTFTMTMGVDTKMFHPGALSQAAEPLRLVTVARLNVAKGHSHALEALRKAIDAGAKLRYSIVGSGPNREAIEATIRRLSLGEHVELLGSLGEAQIAELLRQSHIFLLPSVGIGEASPVVVMEAMASGLAVVCSRIGGTADMISDGIDGLIVECGDEPAIQAALQKLCSDREYREGLGRAARLRAERQFDAVGLAQSFLDTVERFRAEAGAAQPTVP